MPAGRVPNIDVPPIDPKTGRWNVVVWRWLASLAAQFSGTDAPVMPVNVPGLQSIANAQSRPQQLSEAAIAEAVQRILGALRARPAVNREAEQLAAIALRPHTAAVNGQAAELAAIALSRISSRQAAIVPQIAICTQATFPTLAGTAPTFIYVSDFAHWIYWDGTTAAFADGGSNYYTVAASAPSAIGWHAVDGSPIHYLNADGTLTAKTLANVAGTPAYLKVGAGTDTLNAPVAPTISGHTDAASTGITVSAAAAATAGSGSINNPASGTPTTVLEPPFSGGGGGGVVTDGGHAHNLSAANAPISTTGEPENFYSQLWFRL